MFGVGVCVCAEACDSSAYGMSVDIVAYMSLDGHTWDIFLTHLGKCQASCALQTQSDWFVGATLASMLSSLCMKGPWGSLPPGFFFHTSLRSSFLPFTSLYSCSLNPTLNYPTTDSQRFEMDLIIIISASEVHLGTAAFSTATRRHVLVAGGAMEPFCPNCFRQVKETGGRMCSCAPHVPGSRSAGNVSQGRRDTAAKFRVCSTL